jgi:hypothetical protein
LAGVRSISQPDELRTTIGARAQQLEELAADPPVQGPSTLARPVATVDHIVSCRASLSTFHNQALICSDGPVGGCFLSPGL